MSSTAPAAETVHELADDVRAATRDLVLVLADSKRLLGTRYAEWILGAPELEAGIACASMAQDEWGHGRLLYALLKEFGDEVDRLEHGRDAGEYRSIEALDKAPQSWAGLIVLNVFVDTSLTIQLEALRVSSWLPLRQRVGKMLDEEHFHAAHGAAWLRRMAQSSAELRAELERHIADVLPVCLAWFGPASARAERLVGAGIADAAADELRRRYVHRLEPLLALMDRAADASAHDLTGFDEAYRRSDRTGPDDATISRVRGDRNRTFLMD
jgi:ring-1,2-phenylacetyl-CoA epoxidase subunit PaaC